ncbi:uncharacterized protein [Rutidosis leptorrhynchoides]|uniref:uncharacterized protein n=1 Tax=Rutidosis leptorrhynchoides TaxID=125765 RepID=UPI003A99562A
MSSSDEESLVNAMKSIFAYRNNVVIRREVEEQNEAQSSRRKRRYIRRDRVEAHNRLVKDYFVQDPKYPPEYFKRRYRMSQSLLEKIIEGILSYSTRPDAPKWFTYFQQRPDARGVLGVSTSETDSGLLRHEVEEEVDQYMMASMAVSNHNDTRDGFTMVGRGCVSKQKKAIAVSSDDNGSTMVLSIGNINDNKSFVMNRNSKLVDSTGWFSGGGEHERVVMGVHSDGWKVVERDEDSGLLRHEVEEEVDQYMMASMAVSNHNDTRDGFTMVGRGCVSKQKKAIAVSSDDNGSTMVLSIGNINDNKSFVMNRNSKLVDSTGWFSGGGEHERVVMGVHSDGWKVVERDEGRWGILRQPARAYSVNKIKRIMYGCIILHNMIIEDNGFNIAENKSYYLPVNNLQGSTWYERCDVYAEKTKELRDKDEHEYLRHTLVSHLWHNRDDEIFNEL